MTATGQSYALEGLTRRFPGVLAVDHVDLTVAPGEIHGIIGRNGAGKSVLMGMVAGVIRPSSGTIRVGGHVMDAGNASPIYAHRVGVSLIPQEPKFAGNLTVVDNMYMGRHLTGRFALTRPKAMAAEVEAICARLSIEARPQMRMSDLPIEAQQMLAFGKAVFIDRARVILLDEITASLTQQRKEMLLGLLREIAQSNPTISFTIISHHIAEVSEFTDRVTVMRDGRAVATMRTAESTPQELATWIVGDTPQVAISVPDPVAATGTPMLEARRLACAGELADLDFSVDRGEVVGFAGLEGSGKDTAIEMLFGLRRPTGGEIRLHGRPVQIGSPGQALARHIAFLPKHREAQAVIQNRSVEENTLISSYPVFSNVFGLIDRRKGRAVVRQRTADLRVKTPSIRARIDDLSGGNKQKVLINRLALTQPEIFLLNEPTRGVDISAKPQLLKVIREELAARSAVVMISESEEELVEVCDRILVFFKGRVAAVIRRDTPAFTVGEVYRRVQGVQPQ